MRHSLNEISAVCTEENPHKAIYIMQFLNEISKYEIKNKRIPPLHQFTQNAAVFIYFLLKINIAQCEFKQCFI
jgi:hypothetical protein